MRNILHYKTGQHWRTDNETQKFSYYCHIIGVLRDVARRIFGGGETADAAVTTGTSLFTSSVGSTTVTSTPQAQGILITYKTSAEESAVLYRHNLDMNYFGIKIKVNSKHFESFYVELTDTEDSGNVVVADFRREKPRAR